MADKKDIKELKDQVKNDIKEFSGQMKTDLDVSRKAKDTDDYMDVVFHEPVGYFFMLFFRKIGWSPNMVSILSGIVGIAGGWLFFYDNFWINALGVFLSIIAIILDCTDGQLARITHKTSELGRLIDGGATLAICIVQYLAIGFRMMREPIFLSSTLWGGWCWLMIVPCTVIFHANQDRMADYFRNLHLFFMPDTKSELDHSDELDARYREEKAKKFSFKAFYLLFYTNYTRMQEKMTPSVQRFFALAGRDRSRYPEGLCDDFLKQSRKYIQLTNILTVNFRAYTMFILLLLGLHDWFFPVLGLLEILNIFMITRYEKIAKNLINTYYAGGKQA
ncbi:MAG: hypothetical protein CW338_05160 [Clostridiales bacterium]|nr:hypothetical protein [Clostridiales bacterium]